MRSLTTHLLVLAVVASVTAGLTVMAWDLIAFAYGGWTMAIYLMLVLIFWGENDG